MVGRRLIMFTQRHQECVTTVKQGEGDWTTRSITDVHQDEVR